MMARGAPAPVSSAAPVAAARGGTIGGALPWGAGQGAGGLFQGLGGSPQSALSALGSNYQNAYNSSLQMNQANYNNILQGYQQTAQAQQSALGGVQRGYRNLYGNVTSGIEGSDAAAQQQIRDTYAQQQGSSLQGLVNSGLGNSTVTSSVARGLTADESKSQVNLANQMAQLRAGYQSQIGLAGLGFRGNAALANTNQANQQLQWMNSVNAGYPDAGMYANLAQMYGVQSQAEKDRMAAQNAYGNLGGPSPGGGAAAGLGYVPRPAPTYGSGGGGEGGMPMTGNSLPQFFNPYAGSAGNQFGSGLTFNTPGYGESRGGPPAGYSPGYDQPPAGGGGGVMGYPYSSAGGDYLGGLGMQAVGGDFGGLAAGLGLYGGYGS